MACSHFRDWYIHGKVNELLDKHMPSTAGKRPSLADLEANASLALHFGHPLLMDGNRPVSPNFVTVGMMNCKPAKELPKDLKVKMIGCIIPFAPGSGDTPTVESIMRH